MSATQTSPGAPEARPALLDDELLALLQLRALPGIGDIRGAALLARHGSARAALEAARRERAEPVAAAGWVARALETIDELDIHVIASWDERYPARLKQLHDPPLVLFARGQLSLLERTTVAIVGTRRATEHGLDAAHAMAAGIARFGVTVLSGMALGIDTAAHRAALSVRGATIGVLGAGIDVPYPPSGAELHEQVARRGLLVSEFLPGTPPDRPNFVRRNRIIAALAQAVLVIEAPAKSGALTTVEHALDLNRDVLAVPGPIGRASCEGTNRLLRDGAAVALEPADVLDQIGMGAAGARLRAMRPGSAPRVRGSRTLRTEAVKNREAPVDPVHAALWQALSWDESVHVDVIAGRAGVDAPVAAAGLLQLEMDGRAERGAGMTFRRLG